MNNRNDAIVSKIGSGEYELGDLASYLETISKRERAHSHLRKHYDLFASRRVVERLYTLLMERPAEVYAVLNEHFEFLAWSRHVLLKTYTASLLLIDEEPRVPANLAINSLLDFHPYVALYNPLTILYIGRADRQRLHSLIRQVCARSCLYEANPNSERTVLFRDFFLFAGACSELGLTARIYGEERANRIFSKCPGLSIEEISSIIRSYLSVLKGLLENVCLSLRALNKYGEFEDKVERLPSTISRALHKYAQLSRERVVKNAYSILTLLNGYLCAELENVSSAAVDALKRYVEDREVLRRVLYELLTLAIALKSYSSSASAVERTFEMFNHEKYRGLLLDIEGVLDNALKNNVEVIDNILSAGVEPYRSLRDKLKKLAERGCSTWIRR